MSGAKSRSKGHRWERTVANRLAEAFGEDIRTTRSVGANYGADLCTITGYDSHGRPAMHTPTVLGWSVELKSTERWEPDRWMEQAVNQAVFGTPAVVLANRAHAPFEAGWAIMEDDKYGWVATTIGAWIEFVGRQAA